MGWRSGCRAAPEGRRYFRRTITLPSTAAIKQAECLITADNQFQLWVNGRKVGGGTNFQQLTRFNLTDRLTSGKNVLAVQANNYAPGSNPAGLLALLRIETSEGPAQIVKTDDQWRCAAKAPDAWEALDFDDAAWKPAIILGAMWKGRRAEAKSLASA